MSAPTSGERIVALSLASSHTGTALAQLDLASKIVIPSGDRCVLSRELNYRYQRALANAREALRTADGILQDQVHELVPIRCEWPGGHLGPVVHNGRGAHCKACGEEW